MESTRNQEKIDVFEGQLLLYMQASAHLRPMCLKWAIQLGIPDIISNHGKPITLSELVSALQIPPAKGCFVHRFMHFLAHNGIFDIHEGQEDDHELITYALTPASKLLLSGTDHCLAPMVLFITSDPDMSKYHHITEWIRGEDATLQETAFGTSVWEYLEKNPAHLSIFHEAMASDSQMLGLALKNCTSVFEGLDSIVDVGGGTGTVARFISEAFPKLERIVFDLPEVVENLTGANNLSFIGGDMFKSIPQADAVILKCVLHDWNDENCIKILKKCKDSISSKGDRGKVIIIDIIINEKVDDPNSNKAQQ